MNRPYPRGYANYQTQAIHDSCFLCSCVSLNARTFLGAHDFFSSFVHTNECGTDDFGNDINVFSQLGRIRCDRIRRFQCCGKLDATFGYLP
jgi:hypothetical protein